jgi:hypothetical protein
MFGGGSTTVMRSDSGSAELVFLDVGTMPLLAAARRKLDGSSMDFLAMTNLIDCHRTRLIINEIDDPVVALTNAIAIVIAG